MENYNQSASVAEEQLKNISPTMCYAKWAQSSIHLTNGMTHSCYHPPVHKITIDSIKKNPAALHNTDQKKAERTMMLEGKRPSGCSYCWNIEDLGKRSDRIYRSGESWAQNSLKDILKYKDNGNINPRYLEVNFNQSCNFKCMYCSPHLSSTWEDEVLNYGPYEIMSPKGFLSHNDINGLSNLGLMPIKGPIKENPYVSAFWLWWPSLYKKLEIFRMTGGEPLMDANTFKVMDYVAKHPNDDLEISITSNFCPPKNELFDKFIEKLQNIEKIKFWKNYDKINPYTGNHSYVAPSLKNFSVFVSLDSIGEQAEYIRYGLNFEQLKSNVYKFLDQTTFSTISFINTFNILSVPKIKNFLTFILELRTAYSKESQGIKSIPVEVFEFTKMVRHPDHIVEPKQRIWFDVPLLRNPSWMSIKLLPLSYKSYFEEAIDFMKKNSNVDNFNGFYDFEISKMERNLEFFLERSENINEYDEINFLKFFKEYDVRRQTNFRNFFPELTKFYQELTVKHDV